MRTALGIAALCTALFSCGHALAGPEDNLEAIRRCGGIDDSVKRLACFDEIADGLQSDADSAKAALAKQLVQGAGTGQWSLNSQQSKIDDSTSEYAQLSATESQTVRYSDVKPRIVLRCMEKQTNAYIDFDGAFVADSGGYGEVTFRVDKKPAFTRNLSESTDNQALGFFDGGSAIAFIKALFGGQTLVVRATPYNESAVTFEFDIHGVENAVKPLRKACGWGAPQ